MRCTGVRLQLPVLTCDDGERERNPGEPRRHAPCLVFRVELEHGQRAPLGYLILPKGLDGEAGCGERLDDLLEIM